MTDGFGTIGRSYRVLRVHHDTYAMSCCGNHSFIGHRANCTKMVVLPAPNKDAPVSPGTFAIRDPLGSSKCLN
jgi:hypothetical protein